MPLANPNTDSKFSLLAKELLDQSGNRLVMVDIGSRGGVRPEWQPVEAISEFVGFDADEAECARLNRLYPRTKTFPVALDAESGWRTFFTTESPACGGFRRTNALHNERFPNYINNRVTGEIRIKTSSFDDWAASAAYERFDFIKLDTEGSEIEVLRGASQSIHAKKILGVLTEVWFEPDIKEGRGYGFAALDDHLRRDGFRLFDIQVSRYPRIAMPVGALGLVRQSTDPSGELQVTAAPLRTAWGQVMTGDLLYFRDPIAERNSASEDASAFWDRDTVLRYLVLLDLYNYQDVALEMLSFFRHLFEPAWVQRMVQALLPCGQGDRSVALNYEDYWRVSMELLARMGNVNEPALLQKLQLSPPSFD